MFASEKVFEVTPGEQITPVKIRQSGNDIHMEEENDHFVEELLNCQTPKKLPLLRTPSLKPKPKEFFSLRRLDITSKARRRLSYHSTTTEKDLEEKARDAFANLDVSDNYKIIDDTVWPVERQQKRRRNRLKRLTKDFGSTSTIPPYSSSRTNPSIRRSRNNESTDINDYDADIESVEFTESAIPIKRNPSKLDEYRVSRSVPEFWQVELD
ncbi:DgyrCDS3642 [Dimorphilus gyrociliatus]|uniref:DgyrCDS3642 n=1 Tax=Dimorphilus gyrociliatus TaxID=2664684 RepID=A0A7I8VIX8_9ANNE|nr:DgyrCDS3642 [Dimorphilus gyrociliatus]